MKRLLIFLGLFFALSAQAETHYSALFGQSCFLCHANPTGRGMRSPYGSQFFAPNYLSHLPISDSLLEKIKPQLNESITIGCDFRTIWLAQNTQDQSGQGLSAPTSTNTGSISQMEGYLYLAFQPTEKLLLYYDQGVASASGQFEIFGSANVLPFKGFIKAGQFQENYGWRFADHTSFVRTGLFSDYAGGAGSDPMPPGFGDGVEIGFRPPHSEITASFTNAQMTMPMPGDMQKRWFVRAQVQQGIDKLGLQFTGGGSWFRAPHRYVSRFNEDPGREAWGGFAGIGWQGLQEKMGCHGGFGFLTTSLLFEYDRKAWSPPNPDFDGTPAHQPYLPPITSAYSTSQLTVMVQPGIWLLYQYDWMNNNRSALPEEKGWRNVIGLQVFPLPWVEVSPRYVNQKLADLSLHKLEMLQLQTHFFF